MRPWETCVETSGWRCVFRPKTNRHRCGHGLVSDIVLSIDFVFADNNFLCEFMNIRSEQIRPQCPVQPTSVTGKVRPVTSLLTEFSDRQTFKLRTYFNQPTCR